MKIAVSYRVDFYPKDGVSTPVESYARCVDRALQALGHNTVNVHGNTVWDPKEFDVCLELDNGRASNGTLEFSGSSSLGLPKAVWFVDSHGQADLHRGMAPYYDYVFFAVWDKRDLFTGHKSAHWCPNATDPQFFYPTNVRSPQFNFGFFGSKKGLGRAEKMVELCGKHGWTSDVRQVNGAYKHKWPYTCEAMNNCTVLFNHGQKHDAPNLRVLESMAVGRPLISDLDPRSGMDKLFVEGEHYLAYEPYTFKGLEEKMLFAVDNLDECVSMSARARNLVLEKHLIKNRVEQMLEVFNATL